MNELQVTVDQTPGVISWNYEELKCILSEQMETFKSVVYTDDNIAEAKSDVAALRRLSKAVNARKIEIKNKCLEPYAVIEIQAKELMALIDEPIKLIDAKVKDYEARRRAAKKDKIMDAMRIAFADLPDDIQKKLECKCYDSRWENETSTKKAYMDGIKAAHDETVNALRILNNIDEDFADAVMEVYKVNLDLTAAMMKAQELQKQKELVLERERMRREKEQERKTLAEETKPEGPKGIVGQNVNTAPQIPVQAQPDRHNPEICSRMILFTGTAKQLEKVIGYITFIGAEYELR